MCRSPVLTLPYFRRLGSGDTVNHTCEVTLESKDVNSELSFLASASPKIPSVAVSVDVDTRKQYG